MQWGIKKVVKVKTESAAGSKTGAIRGGDTWLWGQQNADAF